jgi:hypothetical protein
MRHQILALMILVIASCSGDDVGVVHGDSHRQVLDSGSRLDVGFSDAELGDGPAQANDSGLAGERDGGQRADGGGLAGDAAQVRTDADSPARDAGEPETSDGGVAPELPVAPGHRLSSRILRCGGEQISRTALTWTQGRLTGLTLHEFGELSIAWTLNWAQGKPQSAQGRDVDGALHQVNWTYVGNRLRRATLASPFVALNWSYRYDQAGRLMHARFGETIEGEEFVEQGSFGYGAEGLTSYLGLPIGYAAGRPVSIAGEPIRYRGEHLMALPGGSVEYGANRLINRFDEGQGCAYVYAFEAGARAEYFQDSMPFSGLGSLYGSDGVFHGQLDPGRWIYLLLNLLAGE